MAGDVDMVMQMEEATQRFGINISAKKSEVWYIGKGKEDVRIEDIELRGKIVTLVEEFGYLGRVLTSY